MACGPLDQDAEGGTISYMAGFANDDERLVSQAKAKIILLHIRNHDDMCNVPTQ
jgi:hypothetical protein